MRTNINIKNFRVFDKKGVDVELSPLTFLVGCNSSGKSSIVKSLTLLKTFFHQEFNKNHPVIGATVDFSAKPNDTLGAFKNVVNTSSEAKSFSFSYDIHSGYINDDVTVTLTFGEGDMNNAKITGIDISLKNRGSIISENGRDCKGNLRLIKDAFKQYLVATCFREQVHILRAPYDSWNESETLHKEITLLYNKAIKYCDEKYLKEVCNNRNIKICDQINKNLYVNNDISVVEKFAETGIMTYYSMFDEMRDIPNPEDIRLFLESRVKDNKIKNSVLNAIGIICKDYSESGYNNFLEYYCSKEDAALFSSNDILGFDDTLNNDPLSLFGFLTSWCYSTVDPIYAGSYDNNDLLEKYGVSYALINSALGHLSEEEPYSSRLSSPTDPYRDALSFNRTHYLYTNVFREYFNKFIKEVVSKDVTDNISYVGSSRIQVRRLYTLEDRTEFADAVRRYFETKTLFMTLNPPITLNIDNGHSSDPRQVSDFMPGGFMNKWLTLFGVGDHISLEMDTNGLGLLLKVYITENDKEGKLLADVGYGITQLFSILLQIEEMIMSGFYKKYSGLTTPKGFIGKRVVSGDDETPFEPRTIAIEEPEIHLHPKLQSLLAEMFWEAYKKYNIQFIVETHSEYLLRKVQTLIGAKKLTPEEVSMTYVEDDKEVKWGTPKVRRIPIKEDGRLSEPFSPGFYDEADNLSLELFTNMGK